MKVEERFWSKVDRSADCWVWTAGKSADGYGNFKAHGRDLKAHRFAYEASAGPIGEGLTIDHLCRNRACVNPAHLEPVTRKENVLRGIGYTAQQARKTHCKRGHEFTESNTYLYRGSRLCRTCRAARDRARAAVRQGRASRG